ncbi:MAG: energy-coupling factor ABC transporter ATP-binding protein [Fidelibacterota bacterium]
MKKNFSGMIKFSKIRFSFPSGDSLKVIFDNFSLRIEESSFTAMIGKNGSGKSTLAKLAAGILKPEKGEILIDGYKTGSKNDLKKVRRLVGLTFQNPEEQLICTSVEREIAFELENFGVPPDEMRDIVENSLRYFKIGKYRKVVPYYLSAGEKQKVVLAASWAIKKKYLILDEPSSYLDPVSRKELVRLLKRMNSDGTAILFITQFPMETLEFERLLILNKGKIIFDGNPEEGIKNKKIMERSGFPKL